MKPNLFIVQPPHIHLDAIVEEFCERLSDSHYVYLDRPHSDRREDSPAGVRFLSHPLDHLPGFGSVDTAISIGDTEAAACLRECYPEAKLAVWHPGDDGKIPDEILLLLGPGEIGTGTGESEERDFARAI